MISANEALDRLRHGNLRFAAGSVDGRCPPNLDRRADLAGSQEPFAVVLGCSDSRVPPEMVFDQDLGDLFVLRVAGHVVTPTVVGSLEFAVEQLGARLIVVLGHSQCGAIGATLEHLVRSTGTPSASLRSIFDRIRPSVSPLLTAALLERPEELLAQSVRAHVRSCTHRLCHESEILDQLRQRQELTIVGAEYSLETGLVDFFLGAPPTKKRAEGQ